MSRKVLYNKEFLTNLWEEYHKSGKKLKEYCTDNKLNYISIYTALRKNDIMKYLKKKVKVVEVQEVKIETKEVSQA